MEPMKKGHHRLEVMSHYYGKRIQQDMSNFVKWILLALLIGGSGWRCQQFICRVSELGDTVSGRQTGGCFIIAFWWSVDCIFISEDWKRGQRNKPGTLYDPVAG